MRHPDAVSPAGTPVSTTPIEVRMPDLDAFGHVNHAVFLTYLEHGRFHALKDAGFAWSVLTERDWKIYVVRVEIDYLSEAKREDPLLVRTWVESFRRTSMVLAQEIVRDDDTRRLVTRSRVTAVWMGPDNKPMRVPDNVRDGLSRPTSASDSETE